MHKRFFSILAAGLLVFPVAVQAIPITSPANFSEARPGSVFEGQYTEKSASVLESLTSFFLTGRFDVFERPENPLLEGIKKEFEQTKDLRTKILLGQLLGGKPFYSSSHSSYSRDGIVAVPVTEEQWNAIIAKTRKTIYKSGEFYREPNDKGFWAKLGDFAVSADSAKEVKKVIDLAIGSSTKSLSNDVTYQNISNSFLSPRIFSYFTNDWKDSNDFYPHNRSLGLLAGLFLLNWQHVRAGGVSVSEDSDGYAFTAKVEGNPIELNNDNIKLNVGGSFTPNLYGKFPNAKPVLYLETFNQKENFPETEKFTFDGAPIGVEIEQYKKEYGFDIEAFLKTFEGEFAFGIQYDENSSVPYFTLMGNVQNNKEAGLTAAKNLAAHILDLLGKKSKTIAVPEISYTQSTADPFTKITFDADALRLVPPEDGIWWGKTIITIGVTDDGLFMASTYPDIEKTEMRSGFASDQDFSSFPQLQKNSKGVLYLSLRNLWDFEDQLIAKNEHPLVSYRTHYLAIEKELYRWRDVMISKYATQSDVSLKGKFVVDEAKHKTYAEFMQEAMSKDQDSDGVSDFEERHLYGTPVDSAEKAAPPPFKDVKGDGELTRSITILRKKGAISGYPNGTFRPGKLVNRAEFVAMLVKTFEEPSSVSSHTVAQKNHVYYQPLGRRSLLVTPPWSSLFSDIDINAWYALPLAKAYDAGFFSPEEKYGSYGRSNFRPNDLITKKEAVHFLNNISIALKEKLEKTNWDAKCDPMPFTDIDSMATDHSCLAIMNAYDAGLVQSKSKTQFGPDLPVTRGEAAVMLARALQYEWKFLISEPENSEDDIKLFDALFVLEDLF